MIGGVVVAFTVPLVVLTGGRVVTTSVVFVVLLVTPAMVVLTGLVVVASVVVLVPFAISSI